MTSPTGIRTADSSDRPKPVVGLWSDHCTRTSRSTIPCCGSLRPDSTYSQSISSRPRPYGGKFWSEALAWRGRDWGPSGHGRVYRGIHGMPVSAGVAADDLDSASLAGLVIPGGYVADHLRRSPAVLELVRRLVELHRPVAAICHGPWVLSSAGVLDGRRVTGHWVIRPDLKARELSGTMLPWWSTVPSSPRAFPMTSGRFANRLQPR